MSFSWKLPIDSHRQSGLWGVTVCPCWITDQGLCSGPLKAGFSVQLPRDASASRVPTLTALSRPVKPVSAVQGPAEGLRMGEGTGVSPRTPRLCATHREQRELPLTERQTWLLRAQAPRGTWREARL